MTLRMSIFASHAGGLSLLLKILNQTRRGWRRLRWMALGVAVVLSGCVQSLDDLGVASHDIPPKLLASMRAKGMNAGFTKFGTRISESRGHRFQ
ncbi:hypothetical protein [Rhizobium ruizarguesonis]|uniref:hypothetical protein n=1 Tax=Rhizobium ruizarguesonis TaxID=2081791 RepID=UPI0018D56ED1|nr:hypothetical protein [Rhizobium ruizarguesonis]